MSLLKIGMIALAVSLANADTITTMDSRTWNGTVGSIGNGVLTLNAVLPGQSKTLNFGANYIRAIEFNTTTYNAGTVLPPPNTNNSTLPGVIYLKQSADSKVKGPLRCDDISSVKGSGQVSCKLASGDPQNVSTKDVVRILVGH
jgi:hypothetical protein